MTRGSEAQILRELINSSLAGKVAIVTGGGQGIGRVFAKAYALAGAMPVIAEKNSPAGQSVVLEPVLRPEP